MNILSKLLIISALLFITTTSAQACLDGIPIGRGQAIKFIPGVAGSTYTTPYVLPLDWTPVNTIDAYGEGGADYNEVHIGSGGGAFARVYNLNDAAGTSEPVQIGGGDTIGSGGSATPTYFKSTSYLKADYGRQTAGSQVGGLGGSVANSVGTLVYAGGNGGTGDSTHKGTGSGGSAGPNGAGANGGGGTTCIIAGVYSGGGGGGANGGYVGATGVADTGPCTDNGTARGGAGGNGIGNFGGGIGSVVDSTGGGPATAGSGGGGGGDTDSGVSLTDGLGAVDSSVYGSTVYGPSGGQGGMIAADTNGHFIGYGCGTSEVQTGHGGCPGLIVITYTCVTPGLFLPAPPKQRPTLFIPTP